MASRKKLRLNPDFQRGSVWVPAARVYLIDTILRGLPVPKIYLRTTIDTDTQASVRDVVDGQQRLKAILDFAADGYRLTSRAKEFDGLTYSTLSAEQKTQFLEYPLAVEQLLNATENDVLEVFARLNSYNVTLNPAEKRHAKFQGKFKWHVREVAREWSELWKDYGLLSTRQRVRMEDDVTMAQMFMIVIDGVRDGGADKIDRFYKSRDEEFPEAEESTEKVNSVLTLISDKIIGDISGTALGTTPQLLMLFAAAAHRMFGIPNGELEDAGDAGVGVGDLPDIRANLQALISALTAESAPERLANFVNRSTASTQRIASRRVRYKVFYDALGSDPI